MVREMPKVYSRLGFYPKAVLERNSRFMTKRLLAENRGVKTLCRTHSVGLWIDRLPRLGRVSYKTLHRINRTLTLIEVGKRGPTPPKGSTGSGLSKGSAGSEPPTFNDRVKNLAEAIKPYRDLVLWLVGAVVTISTVVGTVIAYFATHMEVSQLECRVFHHVEGKLIPLRESVARLARTQERKQADLLLDINPDENKKAIQYWNKDANDLESGQEQAAKTEKNEFAALVNNCDVGPQKNKSAPP